MLKVLLYSHPRAAFSAVKSGLVNYLTASGKIKLDVTEQTPGTGSLQRTDVLILAGALPLTETLAEELVSFVGNGGGLVCLGDALDDWADWPILRTAFGVKKGSRTPTTELIVRIPAASNHPLTRRLYAGYAHDHYAGLDLDTAFPLTDSFYLSDRMLENEASQTVLLVSWHSSRLPVAWVQSYGQGRFFATSLGTNSASWQNPVFQQLIFRAINDSAGQVENKTVRVGMLGYGAIGFEHGTAISQVPGLKFAAVCDRNPARLEEATRTFNGVKTYGDAQQMIADPDLDLVIVSTPPSSHASMALSLLEAGKHVVVEKPFCLTTREADAMIAKAEEVQRVLTVYQCRRWDADYLAIKAALGSGLIGDVFHVETFIGGFSHPCDYWHSHAPVSGGVFYDWGSHYLDWLLGIMPGQVESVSGFAHKRVWHDVTNEDQAKVLLRFEGGREAEFIHSDIAAAMKPKWYILGTKGAIVGHWREESVKTRRWSGDLIEERLAPSEALPVLTAYLRQEGGLIHEQKLAMPPAPIFPFHRNLANHLLLGEPLAVTPQEARRNIAVMEAARLSACQGGQFIKLGC